MHSNPTLTESPCSSGFREVMSMSGPIILGMLSVTIMEFFDKVMVSYISTDALAGIGSAGIASFSMTTLYMGIISVVSTFVAQCYGRGEHHLCARYGWQGLYLSLLGLVFAAILYPLSVPMFRAMGHTETITALELEYFRIRLAGYVFVGVITALAAFFQAVNRSRIPMYAAIVGNFLNLSLNYLLIFGKFGFPRMGIGGAALATVIAMGIQSVFLLVFFFSRSFREHYGTHRNWRFDWARTHELLRIGIPSALTFFLDVANWWIFVAFIVGRLGAVELAASTIALGFIHICFLPAIGLNHGIAAIVGQWLGRRNVALAKARTYTAIKIAMVYMGIMGVLFALFGDKLIMIFFRAEPEVALLGHKILILAAFFQAFDAINIVSTGALRGAGDTRWMMVLTFVMSYLVFLPLAVLFGFVLQGGVLGAWLGATLFIMLLAGLLFRRFYSEAWLGINIFKYSEPGGSAKDPEVSHS